MDNEKTYIYFCLTLTQHLTLNIFFLFFFFSFFANFFGVGIEEGEGVDQSSCARPAPFRPKQTQVAGFIHVLPLLPVKGLMNKWLTSFLLFSFLSLIQSVLLVSFIHSFLFASFIQFFSFFLSFCFFFFFSTIQIFFSFHLNA